MDNLMIFISSVEFIICKSSRIGHDPKEMKEIHQFVQARLQPLHVAQVSLLTTFVYLQIDLLPWPMMPGDASVVVVCALVYYFERWSQTISSAT